jgi:glyoxylase-like metal-dependent hydrolase (beta-lactamase superfamily II)
MASAARVYGEERLQRLFGTMRPVPADRIRTLGEADMIDLGNRSLTALYTPGHARHHVALQDRSSGAVFTGDAVGIHLPGIALLRPATPPPEFDMELAIRSIERIRRHARWTLMFSHFGPVGSVDETCTVAIETIRRWGELVHAIMATTEDLTAVSAALEAATRAEHVGLSDGERRHLEAVSSYETNSAGLLRYWSTPAAPS